MIVGFILAGSIEVVFSPSIQMELDGESAARLEDALRKINEVERDTSAMLDNIRLLQEREVLMSDGGIYRL
jgi:hypothetical protein